MHIKINHKIFCFFTIIFITFSGKFFAKEIEREEYCTGCCACDDFVFGRIITHEDLYEKIKTKGENLPWQYYVKKFFCKKNFNDKKVTIFLKNISNEDERLLKIHNLIIEENFREETEKEEKQEDLENPNEDLKNEPQIKTVILPKVEEPVTSIKIRTILLSKNKNFFSRFIKIEDRIPCIYCVKNPEKDKDINKDRNEKIIIFFHGNGDSILNHFNILTQKGISAILNQGFDLAIIEYKGGPYYDGKFDEKDFREQDAGEILNFFSQLYKKNNIISLGYSLGCSFAAELTITAEKIFNDKITACIMVYPFVNIKQAGKHIFEKQGGWWGNHFSWLIKPCLKKRFNNAYYVSQMKSNLFLFKNKNDNICDENSVEILKNAYFGKEKEVKEAVKIKDLTTYDNGEKGCTIFNSSSEEHTQINWEEVNTILENINPKKIKPKYN